MCKSNEMTYVALVRASACRDTQIAKVEDADLRDDDAWMDMPEAEMFVGLFTGTEAAVLNMAADFACTCVDNIRLLPVNEAEKV